MSKTSLEYRGKTTIMTPTSLEYRGKTTIMTPTFMVTRVSPGASTLLGWMLFFLLLVALCFLLLAMLMLLKMPLDRTLKIVGIGVLVALLFLLVAFQLIVDVLCSIDAKLSDIHATSKSMESNIYNTFVLVGKCQKKK